MFTRLDQFLTQKGWARTRSQAQLLIKTGKVKVGGKLVTKAGFLVTEEDQINLESTESYVGRGALKIRAAIEEFGIKVQGKIIADCGASTGGFTDYLLQQGASKSYCIDVGHDQLDESLKNDPSVVNLEGVNLKHPFALPEKVNLVVADLSFISLRLVLPTIKSFLKEDGDIILLFKPQFEVGPSHLNKKGVVKKEGLREQALEDFKSWCKTQGLNLKGVIESPVQGKEGNKEYLIWLR